MKKVSFNKINIYDVFYLFVIFSMLCPKGHFSYSLTYKRICSICIWISVFFIWIQFIAKSLNKRIKIKYIYLSLYFIVSIILTFLIRKNVDSGLQQLFFYPSICLFMISNLKLYPKKILNTINNVTVINFTLNIFLQQKFFSNFRHMTFLGHVQSIAQIGLVGILSGILYLMIYKEKKIKIYYILFIVSINLLCMDALTSFFTLLFLLFFYILYIIKFKMILSLNSKKYITVGLLLNLCMIYLSIKYTDNVLYNFSGRRFVWIDAIKKIKLNFVFGYGVDGVLLQTFWLKWSGSAGFNYAHNQILQNLLDGGIVLLMFFWLMFYVFCSSVNKIKEKKYKILCNSVIIILMGIMIVESVTLYCYIFIILSIIFSMPDIIDKEKEFE